MGTTSSPVMMACRAALTNDSDSCRRNRMPLQRPKRWRPSRGKRRLHPSPNRRRQPPTEMATLRWPRRRPKPCHGNENGRDWRPSRKESRGRQSRKSPLERSRHVVAHPWRKRARMIRMELGLVREKKRNHRGKSLVDLVGCPGRVEKTKMVTAASLRTGRVRQTDSRTKHPKVQGVEAICR